MPQIKHVFFDLDRTLWDFETNSKKALQALFREHRLAERIAHFEHFHYSYSRVNSTLWNLYGKGRIQKEELRNARFQRTLEHHDIFDEVLAMKLSDGYIALSPRQTQLFPNTLETLTELQKNGYRMHIITNGFEEVQHIKLQESKLTPFFDVIVCSEAVGYTKPDSRVFQYALDKAEARASESVMIGDDRKADIMGAIQSGRQAVLFDPERKFRSTKGEPKIADLGELPLLLTMMAKP
jgi:putative hydrolase of the HAD superfamily